MGKKNLKQKLISFITKEIWIKYGGFCPECGIRMFFVKGKFRCPCCDFCEVSRVVETEKDEE